MSYYPELPKACPECGRDFGATTLRPTAGWSWLAKLVFVTGILVVCLMGWAIMLSGMWKELLLAGRRGHLVLAGHALAAFAVGLFAYRMPRVMRIRCYKCGWKAAYKTKWGR